MLCKHFIFEHLMNSTSWSITFHTTLAQVGQSSLQPSLRHQRPKISWKYIVIQHHDLPYFPDKFNCQFVFERLGFWEHHEFNMCVFVKHFSFFYLLLVSLRVGEESQNPMDHFSSQVGNTLQLFHYFHLQIFKKKTIV